MVCVGSGGGSLSIVSLMAILIIIFNHLPSIEKMPVKFNPEKTILLIDASSYLYRAYYSVRPLHTPEGETVQAVYGFCRMFKKLIDTFNPLYCALVWDSKGATTRHEIFPAYKATRQAPPSDLFIQKERIMQFADLIGCLQVARTGIEADDLMYSIAKEQAAAGYTVLLITSDKDMGQAITDRILIYDPSKEIMYNRFNFQEKMGVPVEKLPFYFALLGDASDNIPGVHGIGKKGAEELVNQFASLDDMYAHVDLITKPRMRTALQENRENAYLSRDLFLLQYYPSHVTPEDLAFDKKNWARALPFFQELRFKNLVEGIGAVSSTLEDKKAYWQKTYTFSLITTREQLEELCADLRNYKAFAIDTETNGLDSLQTQLVGISVCAQEGKAYYIPCGHRTNETQLSLQDIHDIMRPLLENPDYKKYLHNAKFDQKVLWSHGINLAGIVHDTWIAAALVAKDGRRTGLKYLSLQYFGEDMFTYDEMVKKNTYKDFSYVPLEDALYYAAADAHQTYKLVPILQSMLTHEHMESLYRDIEMPICEILFHMECEGIICDGAILQQLNTIVTRDIARIEQEIQAQAGFLIPINLNSPKQVQDLLFNILKLPPQKKSEKGDYSTDQSVLAELARLHVVPRLIMKHRELSKLKNTYIDALPHYINPKTGRIHTTYNQGSVATGRLASVEPNMQNIPLDNQIPIRSAFKPKEGHIFISADYSQIELRVLAHISKDETLMQAFKENRDIHQETAAGLFDVPSDQVTSEQRQVGKRINFSVLYGMTPYGLSKDMDIPFSDAKLYIDRYFKQYPGVMAWMEDTVEFAKKHGYVSTLWGRRRYIPAINEKNRALYQEAQRIAINTVAQGTAAEIMKLGMIRLSDLFAKRNHGEKIVLQIHDELLVSVPIALAADADAVIRSALEDVTSWEVPLVVTTRHGYTWQNVSK